MVTTSHPLSKGPRAFLFIYLVYVAIVVVKLQTVGVGEHSLLHLKGRLFMGAETGAGNTLYLYSSGGLASTQKYRQRYLCLVFISEINTQVSPRDV